MIASFVVICCVQIQHKPVVEHLSILERNVVSRLAKQRDVFFGQVRERTGNGYFAGEEGSWHEIYFPIGKSSPMYFEAYVNGGEYTECANGKEIRIRLKTPYVVTCWTKASKGNRKAWQHYFIVKNDDPNHVVSKVDTRAKYWREALAFRNSKERFVGYHYGIHGDVSLQARCFFKNCDEKEDEWEPQPLDSMRVPNGEVRLMRKLHLFPKPRK